MARAPKQGNAGVDLQERDDEQMAALAKDSPAIVDELDWRGVNPRLVVEHREKIRVECLKLAAETRSTVTEPANLIMTAQTLEAWVIGDFDRVPAQAGRGVRQYFFTDAEIAEIDAMEAQMLAQHNGESERQDPSE